MYDLLVKNGKIVTPDCIYEADIAVDDGVFAAFLAKGTDVEANEVIDAKGNYVFPGIIIITLSFSSTIALNPFVKKSTVILRSCSVKKILFSVPEVPEVFRVTILLTYFCGIHKNLLGKPAISSEYVKGSDSISSNDEIPVVHVFLK
mgnify:CR=1 FL=1